ncbi:YIP1 family protein [Candidatus Woesearchaeota archaeon]|nr:YIP1 family protein [Candidatus Woesearchaeota archaeon]
MKGVFDRFKQLFSHPNEFFQEVKKEKSILGGFELFFLVSVFALLVQVVVFGILPLVLRFYNIAEFTQYIVSNAAFVIVSVAGLFVMSAVIHLMLKLFKGRGTYTDTFNVVAYSLVPFVLLSVIPFFGVLVIFYTIFLLVIGLMRMHNLDGYKVVFSLILPFAALMILFISLITFLMSQAI